MAELHSAQTQAHQFNDHFTTGVSIFLNEDSDVKGKPNMSLVMWKHFLYKIYFKNAGGG